MKRIGLIGLLAVAPLFGCDTLEGRFGGTTEPTTTPSGSTTAPAIVSLTVSVGVLSPPFSEDVTSYTVEVANSVGAIAFTPAATAGAAVAINGVPVGSGTTSSPFPLVVGPNVFSIDATGETSTRTYAVLVTRGEA